MNRPPIVIIGYGNPSRGDDAVGPLLIEELEQEERVINSPSEYELITDFQLQIEHVTDLEERKLLLFVDASLSAKPPFEFSRLTPGMDHSYTSHSLTPATLLSIFETVFKQPSPPAYLLKIPGYQFDLGMPLSQKSSHHLKQAKHFIHALIKDPRQESWEHQL
ncbi:MAG: hydrogenase maturation protease [Sedimenticola sp.]|nr:hydrogenase maturation protease [Sedimenticola sp.]MCW8950686.1 hydrogenase maturation protease [Sedimenticola sp.]